MVGLEKKENYYLNKYPKVKWILNKVRAVIGMKEVPLPKEIMEHMQTNQDEKAVAIIPIGLKEDIVKEDGMERI